MAVFRTFIARENRGGDRIDPRSKCRGCGCPLGSLDAYVVEIWRQRGGGNNYHLHCVPCGGKARRAAEEGGAA